MWTLGFFGIFVALLFAGKLQAGEISPNEDVESILRPGHEYFYKFESEAFAEAVGSTDDRSKIAIQCDVRISHARDCLYTLQLDKCLLDAMGGPPGSESAWISQQPLTDLTKYPVLFSLNDGEIMELHTDEKDALQWVNIKRGALSAFIFKLSYTKQKVQELHTDIHGVCPLTATPIGGSQEGMVRTSKDMLHCAFPSRKDWQLSPWSMFWNMSFIQYVINSTQDCNYDVNVAEKRMNLVQCKERHAIMLESSARTAVAVQSNIYYKMTYQSSGSKSESTDIPVLPLKTSIQYEFERTPTPQSNPENFLEIAQKQLADLVQDSVDEIRLFTISQFTDFVAGLRSSSDLIPFVDVVKSGSYLSEKCSTYQKDLGLSYLRDALVQCNSVPCIEAVRYLAKNKDLSLPYLNFIYYSWSNMHVSKPEILKIIMSMCQETKSDLCWTSLASLVRRTYASQVFSPEELEELKEVAKHFQSSVHNLCQTKQSNETAISLIRDLKAISNLGETYLKLQPHGYKPILECLTENETPLQARSFAFQALLNINPCQNQESCDEIYHRVLSLLLDRDSSATIRSLAFEYLIHKPQDKDVEVEIIKILTEKDENRQLKSFIASRLKNLLDDPDFLEKETRFVKNIKNLLNDQEIALASLMNLLGVRSSSLSEEVFLDLPFMPKELKGFGFKKTTSKIYEPSELFPRYFRKDLFVKVFSKLIHVFEDGGYTQGLEDLAILFQKYVEDFGGNSPSIEKLTWGLGAVLNEMILNEQPSEVKYKFNESVIKNVQKLEEIYRQYKPKLNSFFAAFLDLFGSTLKLASQSDVLPFLYKLNEMKTFMFDLEQILEYNQTKMIRVIEAYHQVPTMMGLPLNWTTDATLAFSLRYRSGPDEDSTSGMGGYSELQPSIALTFLNRMVIDFPTITRIGVQANSSAYTSTQWKDLFNWQKSGLFYRITKPSQTQKLLELFRTNQLIKHDKYEDIQDWDIERTSKSSCTSDLFSQALGLQFCVQKSYPLVTHRMKPWALMSGWCKWQLLMHPTDEKLIHYFIRYSKLELNDEKRWMITFSTPDSDNSRTMIFESITNDVEGESKYKLNVESLPEFLISYRKARLLENNKQIGYRSVMTAKFHKDVQYQFSYNNQYKKERREGVPSNPNASPKDNKIALLIHERVASLNTPHDKYVFSEETTQNGENVSKNIRISYENHTPNPSGRWLHAILPPSFWEEDHKAWGHLQMNWKEKNCANDGVTRQTIIFFRTPKTVSEMSANSFDMSGRQQISLNLTKSDKMNGKMLAFANFTYDTWTSYSQESRLKEIKNINLTISQKSWAARYQRIRDGKKYQYEVLLKRAAMTSKNKKDNTYIGWWNKETSETHDLKEHQVKLVADLDMKFVMQSELPQKLKDGLMPDTQATPHMYVTVKGLVQYPTSSAQESVTLDSDTLITKNPSIYRFRNDLALDSSYNNLNLKSRSVYEEDKDTTSIDHTAQLLHPPSGTSATNAVQIQRSTTTDGCREIQYGHILKSHVVDLVSNVSYRCNGKGKDLHTLLLNTRSNSSYWNMLDLLVEQIVEDVSPDYAYESCNFTHPDLLINVTADWRGVQKEHKKRALFTCRHEGCQSSELQLYVLPGKKTQLKILMAGDEKPLVFERQLSSDAKKLRIKMKYSDDETDDTKDLSLSGQIVQENYHIWNLRVNVDTYARIKSLVNERYEAITKRVEDISKDPEHPLNKILQPALKMTLFDYFKSSYNQYQDLTKIAWESLKESVISIRPFYEQPIIIVTNIANVMKTKTTEIYNKIKDDSVIIWAINYFHVPHYIYEGIIQLPKNVISLLQLMLPQDRILRWEFSTGAFVSLNSFREWPSIAFNRLNPFNWKRPDIEERGSSQKKIALIFGPQHVHTFDHHSYESVEYPSEDCKFLLAHDLRRSYFTVFSDQKHLYVLLPEMSVTINDKNEVFINESQVPTKLPLHASNGKVVVRRSSLVEIWTPSLTVKCSSQQFLCSLELSSWHSGGTFGLLGNADGDTENEFQMPDGKIAKNIQSFISSYEISGQSQCGNLQTPREVTTYSEEAAKHCETQFNSLCEQPKGIREPLLNLCKADFDKDPSSCHSLAAYSALCYYDRKPSSFNCNGKKQENPKIGNRLEVVFMVNQHESMSEVGKKSVPYKGIERLLTALDDKFKAKGYSSVKFSVVGFGGSGAHFHPSVYVKGREEWVPLEIVRNDLLKTLTFNGSGESGHLKMVRYASQVLGYDSFHSKIFVVLTTKDKQSNNKKDIENLQNYMEKNGITFYTIASYPSLEKGKKVFGVRADGLIFPPPKKEGNAYLDFPKGDLAKLSSATKGSVFLSKFILANGPASFFEEFAQEVWAKVNKESQSCRKCTMVNSAWWWQVNECSIGQC